MSGDRLTDMDIAHFQTHGWLRLDGAFDAQSSAAMRDAVWAALAKDGVHSDQPGSWTVERPAHLQHLKQHPAFERIGTPRLFAAIDTLLEGSAYPRPDNWGSAFLAFPSDVTWNIPTGGWHIDAKYTSPLWPPRGVKSFALLDTVTPRGGGTLFVSGSHRLVHRWFAQNPPPPGTRSADMRRRLLAHPYIGALHTPGDPGERIARFMDQPENVDGIPLQVIEHTGEAGNILLAHPLLMHVAAPNNSAQPRFLLSGGVTTDMWGWDVAQD